MNDFELKRGDVEAIAKLLGQEMDTLVPWKCAPSTLVVHLAAVLRDYLRSKGERPSVTLIDNGVYVSRASKLSVEVVFGTTCLYLVFPGPLDLGTAEPIEKAIQAHHMCVKGDLGEPGEWDAYFLAFSRQPSSEPPYGSEFAPFTGPMYLCGEYRESDLDFPNRRLWLSAAQVNPNRGLPFLIGI